jgi:hypothetical protein
VEAIQKAGLEKTRYGHAATFDEDTAESLVAQDTQQTRKI